MLVVWRGKSEQEDNKSFYYFILFTQVLFTPMHACNIGDALQPTTSHFTNVLLSNNNYIMISGSR